MSFIKYLSGSEGRITVPHLGAVIGAMDGWTLTRRGESGPDAALYDLRASFSRFFNRSLYDDPDYEKKVVVVLQRGKEFEVKQAAGHKTSFNTLNGIELRMEGVTLAPLE